MSYLENLPVEVFGHIIALRGLRSQDAVPVCSTRCKEMWLEFAERQTTLAAAEFVRPFEFTQGSSLTQRYYQVHGAGLSFIRQANAMKSIDGTQVEEIIEKVRNLLERNPLRLREVWMLKLCGTAVDSAARGFRQVLHTLRDNVMLQRLSDVSIAISDQSKALMDTDGGGVERERARDLCVLTLGYAAKLCLMNPRDEESALDLANRVLVLDPLDLQALRIESIVRLHRGNVDPAFAAIQRAMRSACSDPRRAVSAGKIGKDVAKRCRKYGSIRCIGLLREAASSLTDLLAENGSVSEERRSKIVTGKAEIEELLGRLTGRQD